MTAIAASLQALPHAIFLHRAVDSKGVGPDSPRVQSRLAQGAFLVLRLIDQLAPGLEQPDADAFGYQWAATERFCRDFAKGTTEGAHLHGLALSARAAATHKSAGLVIPGLFAYAHYLEDALRLEETLDVLDTLLILTAGDGPPADRVALFLRIGRVRRKLNHFNEAEKAYTAAAEGARLTGDRYSEFLSAIGTAISLRSRGNLPEAERRLTLIAAEAERAGERDAQARAEHEMGVVLQHRGSPDTALLHTWRAFELYDHEGSRLRALNDVGVMLLTLGDVVGAERALTEVLRRDTVRDNVMNATIELMHCASFRRDRMGFERYRARCERLRATMPPNILADYQLKVGIGEARFGQYRRAAASLEVALGAAEGAKLNAVVFKIERIRSGLSACEELLRDVADNAELGTAVESEEVRSVSASVANLVAAADL